MGPSLLLINRDAVHMAQGSPFALGLVDGPNLGGLICTGRGCTGSGSGMDDSTLMWLLSAGGWFVAYWNSR